MRRCLWNEEKAKGCKSYCEEEANRGSRLNFGDLSQLNSDSAVEGADKGWAQSLALFVL